MLSDKRAARLAREAERARGSRLTRWRARRGWRILERAGDRGDEAAIEAVWQSWLREPDDARWALLARWRDPAELADAVCGLSLGEFTASREPGVFTGFCLARGLAPADPLRRVQFYLLTRQHEQRSAADPDGTLTARAYAVSDNQLRALLRSALSSAGDLDLVRVIAGTSAESHAPMTPEEREYLASQLAARGDWPGLWQAALGFPVMEAVTAVRLLDPGWRPADERARKLLARLTRVKPGFKLPKDRLGSFPIFVHLPDMDVRGGSFSPDGRRLALRVMQGPSGSSRWSVLEVDLGPREMIRSYSYPEDRFVGSVLHLGDAIVATTGIPKRRDGTRLDMLTRDSTERLADFAGEVGDLAHYGEGFVALERRVGDNGPQSVAGYDRLLHCDQQGRVQRAAALRHDPDDYQSPLCLAVEPRGGRIAVHDTTGVRVYGPSWEQPVGHWQPDALPVAMCFLGASRLAVVGVAESGRAQLQVREIGGRQLTGREVGGARLYPSSPCQVVALPGRGEIAIRLNYPSLDGKVRYFNAETLAEGGHPPGLTATHGNRLWESPGHDALALGQYGCVEIERIANSPRRLASRPIYDFTMADFLWVRAELARRNSLPGERPFLKLLHECLEYRFGTDVAIGESGGAWADPYDIALGPGLATGAD